MPHQIKFDSPKTDSINLLVSINEKKSGKNIFTKSAYFKVERANESQLEIKLPMPDFVKWEVNYPFLYQVKVQILQNATISDEVNKSFGMRDFKVEGKRFILNNQPIFLLGANIPLHRFFEDPDCESLPWNKEWVKKLLIDIPKEHNMNSMRIAHGIVPDFWYDIADENGLLLQNEWMYWQKHGFDEQIRKEYTDWIWADGSHPSIAIWDGINENKNDYIGKKLIPELKQLDPTRIWDAGYMTSKEQSADDIDEPHLYVKPFEKRMQQINVQDEGNILLNNVPNGNQLFKTKSKFPLGDLEYKSDNYAQMELEKVPQLVNEYAWLWLWRNGKPSPLSIQPFEYYLGKESLPEQNRLFQAYFLQLETERIRTNQHVAGVLAFAYLTNNYRYTGDWFLNEIKNLEASNSLKWFKHSFSPAVLFLNITDQRYARFNDPYKKGDTLNFSLIGLNNYNQDVNSSAKIYLLDSKGTKVWSKNLQVNLPSFKKTIIPVQCQLPKIEGGYTMVCELQDGKALVKSRRFITIGDLGKSFTFFEVNP